jgi:hypothetical protein
VKALIWTRSEGREDEEEQSRRDLSSNIEA